MKAKITKRAVDALDAGQILYDTEIKGFVARCLPSGGVSYGYRYRNAEGASRWAALGQHGSITAEQARDLAKKRAGEVANDRDPVAEQEARRVEAAKAKVADKNTVNFVLDEFVARYVEKHLRSAETIKSALDRYVRPVIGETSIYDLTRRQIVEMLDAIEDADKAPTADRVLAYVRKAFNWWATRDDDFKTPIVKGMARTKPRERKRKRMLADDEIRSVWQALEDPEAGPDAFRRCVRVLMLTCQRRDEIGLMHSDELDGRTLMIPPERYKTNLPNAVPLTDAARRWIGNGEGFIFSTEKGGLGKKAFNGWSKAKKELDAVIAKQRKAAGLKPMPHWVLHDLRRTGRSLMSRAGIASDIAEMVLGHKLPEIRATYDVWQYADEKRDALEKLAGLVDIILNPPADNVVVLERAGA